MAKYNIDDILSELGVADANKQANAPARKHTIDKAEEAFSPLPNVPANQGALARTQQATDPAGRANTSMSPTVGPAVADVYRSDGADDATGSDELEALLRAYLVGQAVLDSAAVSTATESARESLRSGFGELDDA